MDTFNKREEGFERAFSHQEEQRFVARARRNRKLAAWAGEMLGLTGEALDHYAANLAQQAATAPDDEALIAELRHGLAAHDISEHRIRRRMEEFGAEALAELQAGR